MLILAKTLNRYFGILIGKLVANLQIVKISKKKPYIPIGSKLAGYLKKYSRESDMPISYGDLGGYNETYPLLDKNGDNTLWDSLLYRESDFNNIDEQLTKLYSLLKTDGDTEVVKHLKTERIDFCHFANSQPYRIKIVNMLNDNYDYMYIKKADASRVYGLELEHLLSPNFISYIVKGTSLVEEHIAGIPGDVFYAEYIHSKNFNKVRFAKEFIKFNERCFVRLLGDMRAYNYVIDITPDFEDEQYRIKAIDFDQQSYEGKKNVYRPQFFKENNPIVKMGMEFMTVETTRQYQLEERTLMARRYNMNKQRLTDLLDCMKSQKLSSDVKFNTLINELNSYNKTDKFSNCKSMGEILELNIKTMLGDQLQHFDIL